MIIFLRCVLYFASAYKNEPETYNESKYFKWKLIYVN